MLEMLHSDADVAQAFFGRVQILSWRNVDAQQIRQVNERTLRHHKRLGASIASLSVVAGPVQIPDAEARSVSAEMAKKIAPVQIASATVIEGEGFWVSAARAAVTGIFLLASTRMPHRAFATVEEGGSWVAGHLSLTPAQRVELVAAAIELRRRHLGA